jgi:hypothetical protein
MASDEGARAGRARIRWAPRVRREKLRRLYEGEAGGMLDAELLDDIGTTIYCRCRDILIVSDAAEGRVKCLRCDSVIVRAGDDLEQMIVCGSCGWESRWDDYRRSYRHQELYARGLTAPIVEFMGGWERAASAREKMMLVDRVIHVWHWETTRGREKGRPAAVNLIEGSRRQVIAFLDELSAGSTPRTRPG